MKLFFTFAIIFTVFLSQNLVQAHSTGASFEEIKDGYLIDVGYSPEELVTGELVRFDLALYPENDSTESPETTNVWFIAKLEDKIVHSSNIHKPELGPTGISWTPPRAGEYDFEIRFEKGAEVITNTNFSLDVIGVKKNIDIFLLSIFGFILLATIFFTYLFTRKIYLSRA